VNDSWRRHIVKPKSVKHAQTIPAKEFWKKFESGIDPNDIKYLKAGSNRKKSR
jgi:hypothetical protein